MAWTSPKTWASNDILTAADMNTYVRDNLSETCPAAVTAAGDMTYADAANSMGGKLAKGVAGSMMVMNDGATAPEWFKIQTRSAYTLGSYQPTTTSYEVVESLASIPDPGRDVAVMAWGQANLDGDTNNTAVDGTLKLGISFDGGSTYTYDAIGVTLANAVDDHLSTMGYRAGTPTGTIEIRMEGEVSTITGPPFWRQRQIMCLILPDD